MGKKIPTTPRSRVRSSLRQLWLRSRERQAALKRDKYTCQECGKKQTKRKGFEVKVQVHHLSEDMDWERLIDYVYRHLLCDPKGLQTLCEKCHTNLGRRHNDL